MVIALIGFEESVFLKCNKQKTNILNIHLPFKKVRIMFYF